MKDIPVFNSFKELAGAQDTRAVLAEIACTPPGDPVVDAALETKWSAVTNPDAGQQVMMPDGIATVTGGVGRGLSFGAVRDVLAKESAHDSAIPVFNSFDELKAANAVSKHTENAPPTGGGAYAAKLDAGKYRFVEMPPNNISYRVAAIDVDDPSNKPAYIFDNFVNKQDATEKLNQARNTPGCQWSGPDPGRMIHVEDYKEGATYENIDQAE